MVVPKRDLGAPKTADPTSYRVTTNVLMNAALKLTASTLLLATDEIKKLHYFKYYLQADTANVFWSIPLDKESRRLAAFQTHKGVFAWDRPTMGPGLPRRCNKRPTVQPWTSTYRKRYGTALQHMQMI